MIDLHTHSLLSDGELLPSELARRAHVNGIKAIAITDHVDSSNIEWVIPALIKVSENLNKYWNIYVIPGVELTHVPIEAIKELTDLAREKGAKIVVGHGESPVEPVIKGTNRAAIEAGVDILAHPGFIKGDEARLAAEKGVCLEITTRQGHSQTNQHVFEVGIRSGAKLVVNSDSHAPGDILTETLRNEVIRDITDSSAHREAILRNSEELVEKIRKGSK